MSCGDFIDCSVFHKSGGAIENMHPRGDEDESSWELLRIGVNQRKHNRHIGSSIQEIRNHLSAPNPLFLNEIKSNAVRSEIIGLLVMLKKNAHSSDGRFLVVFPKP
jgi:hypothetical protein